VEIFVQTRRIPKPDGLIDSLSFQFESTRIELNPFTVAKHIRTRCWLEAVPYLVERCKRGCGEIYVNLWIHDQSIIINQPWAHKIVELFRLAQRNGFQTREAKRLLKEVDIAYSLVMCILRQNVPLMFDNIVVPIDRSLSMKCGVDCSRD